MRVGACAAGRVYLFRLVVSWYMEEATRGRPRVDHPWPTKHGYLQPPINDYFIPRIDKVSRDRPSWKMHAVYPNWSRLLWLPRFEFQEITTGCFEKSVGEGGLEQPLCLHGFQERHASRVRILMAFVTYVSYSHINTCPVYIGLY